MKQILSTVLIVLCTFFSANAKEKTDTLSYMIGLQVSNDIENNILPQLKLDYDVIQKTIKKLLASDKSINIEGTTISPATINEVAGKYFNNELQAKVIAAMEDSTGTTEVFKDPKEKKIVSALIGADYAYNMKSMPYDIDKASFMQALEENHNGKAMFTAEESTDYLNNYFAVIVPQKNKKDSEAWLAGIEKQEGVKKTESGILYKIEADGDMNTKAVKDQDVVKVIYTGTTRKGEVFDSNRWDDMPDERKAMIEQNYPDKAKKDSPIEFPLDRVIKGWTEGMKLIGKGGKITLWIPAGLAYGERGTGQHIGPNEALRFDIELLGVTVK